MMKMIKNWKKNNWKIIKKKIKMEFLKSWGKQSRGNMKFKNCLVKEVTGLSQKESAKQLER